MDAGNLLYKEGDAAAQKAGAERPYPARNQHPHMGIQSRKHGDGFLKADVVYQVKAEGRSAGCDDDLLQPFINIVFLTFSVSSGFRK